MTANTFSTRTIQKTNRSGSFTVLADYTPVEGGKVRIDERTWDEMGIIPNGVESRTLPLIEAQNEFRQRRSEGWQ